jgi:hypothetical protein
MTDYASDGLLADGKERYGESALRNRISSGRTPALSESDADAELLEIAESVYARVRAAAIATVAWPLPGSDDDGNLYREKWPRNVFQRALELFNWRSQAGMLGVSEEQRRIGLAAEKFFDDLEHGLLSWAIGGTTDAGTGKVTAARNRDGTSNLTGVSSRTRETMLDAFRGGGWDYAR